jgi:hypothetical protein
MKNRMVDGKRIFALNAIVASAVIGAGQQAPANSACAHLISAPDVPKPVVKAPVPHPTPQMRSASASAAFAKFVNRRTPGNLSAVDVNDHEDAGILNDGGGPYTGVFAVHTIYSPAQFHVQLPPGATATQTLFAPTTRATNGGCLEVGTRAFGPSRTYIDSTTKVETTVNNFKAWSFGISYQSPPRLRSNSR